MAQWTMTQAQLATLSYPWIGSITTTTESGEPLIGKLSTAAAEGLVPQGPFSTATEYFTAIGKAALWRTELQYDERNQDSVRLGGFVFLDIVQTTGLFEESQDLFHFSHMDLGMQNIIVDDDFNFLALIDWEFIQTAPWHVNHYPMPFSLLWPDRKIKNALDDRTHIAHRNILKQHSSRGLYWPKFREAEIILKGEGLHEGTFAEVLGESGVKNLCLLQQAWSCTRTGYRLYPRDGAAGFRS